MKTFVIFVLASVLFYVVGVVSVVYCPPIKAVLNQDCCANVKLGACKCPDGGECNCNAGKSCEGKKVGNCKCKGCTCK